MRPLSEYVDRYENIRFTRSGDGVLEMQLHTDGGPLLWTGVGHRDLGYAFEDVARDRDNRVLILTGTGDVFCTDTNLTDEDRAVGKSLAGREQIYWEGRRIIKNLFAIDIPIIAAVNGPAHLHAEVPAICDIVLASENASFQDPHFVHGVVPGDGVHLIWPTLLGPNRSRYFQLTGQIITAPEARDLGFVAEVLPPAELMPRARALAAELAAAPTVLLRYTRLVLTTLLHRMLEPGLGYGLVHEVSALEHRNVDGDR